MLFRISVAATKPLKGVAGLFFFAAPGALTNFSEWDNTVVARYSDLHETMLM